MSHLVSFPAGFPDTGRAATGFWGQVSEVAERRSAVVEGVRVSWLERGSRSADAPSLVLLHGLIATAETFLPLMECLGADHHVIALDFPANGGSEQLHNGDASIGAIAAWLAGVLDHLGLDRPVLVGHSHGGAVAMQLAARHPERVRGLVLISPAHPFFTDADLLIRFYLSPLGALFAYALPWFPRWVQLQGFRRMAGPGSWTDPRRLDPYRANLQARGLVPHMLRLLRTWHPDMKTLGKDLSQTLPLPTLMIWGSRDRAVPVESASNLQPHFPNEELVVLHNIGHQPAEEAPADCASLIERWLAGSVPQNIGVRSAEQFTQVK